MSEPMGVGRVAPPAGEEDDGEWEEAHTVGQANGKGKRRGKGRAEGPWKSSDQNKTWQDETDYFP